MNLDYDSINGYAIKDPIGRLCLHEMWIEKLKGCLNPYKNLNTLVEFLTISQEGHKIRDFRIKTLERNIDSYKILIEVNGFDDNKSFLPVIVSKYDYDSSVVGELELVKDEIEQYLPQTHEIKKELKHDEFCVV